MSLNILQNNLKILLNAPQMVEGDSDANLRADILANIDNFYDDSLNDETLGLNPAVVIACALACAYSCKTPTLIDVVMQSADICDEAQIQGAQMASIIMAQNNVYYRSMGLLKDEAYRHLPTQLSAKIVQDAPVSKGVFEYFCIAVSTVNGCKACLNAHSQGLLKLGWQHVQIQSALRIAAIISSLAQAVVIDGKRL